MGFFDQGVGGYAPTMGAFDPPGGLAGAIPPPVAQPQAPVDAFGYAPPQQTLSDRMGGILKSLGIDPADIGKLFKSQPEGPSDAFGYGPPQKPPFSIDPFGGQTPYVPATIGKEKPPFSIDPFGGKTPYVPELIGVPGMTPQDAFGHVNPPAPGTISTQPMPPARPGGGMESPPPGDESVTMMPEGARPSWQNGRVVPLFGTAPAKAPMPPGAAPAGPALAKGESPPPTTAAQPQQSFLARLLGSDDRTVNQAIAGLGAGLSTIGGTGKAANFSRGFGGAIAGSHKREIDDFNMANTDFNARIKLAVTGSAMERNDALTALYRNRALYLQSGGTSKQSAAWQASDYGRMVKADANADRWYETEMKALNQQANREGMEPAKFAEAKKRIEQQAEEKRQEYYKRYQVGDPSKVRGTLGNPHDLTKLQPGTPDFNRAFDNVQPGSYWRGSDGQLRIRPPEPPHPSATSAASPQLDESYTSVG